MLYDPLIVVSFALQRASIDLGKPRKKCNGKTKAKYLENYTQTLQSY